MEPYVPGEEPMQPDLSRIFPAPAEEREAPVAAMPATPGQAARGISPQPIQGTIEVAPELADRIPDGATLFVILRTGDTGPPTAAKKIESPSFPFEFSVGPADRMIQARPFQGPLRLTARLDTDGNAATRSPGDIQGRYPDPVDPGAKSLAITLDEVL
jgi:cytochrome c-type biogenesis protein CcmH